MPIEELGAKLTAIASQRGGGSSEPVFVRGDRGVIYEHIARVITQLKASGFRKVSLITSEPAGG
jgi:biopolymer transport protein ExbD